MGEEGFWSSEEDDERGEEEAEYSMVAVGTRKKGKEFSCSTPGKDGSPQGSRGVTSS